MSKILFTLAKPFLHRMDPEDAHRMTLKALKTGVFPCPDRVSDARLKITLWNRVFPNPVGLAAGFDKNADVVGAMLKIGFGFVEAGTVTPKAQDGNPRPRVFRDGDHEAIINRMGFPNDGFENFRHNIEKFLETKPRPAGVVGINIGMNKGQIDPAKDYCQLVRALGPYADYITVNISSPNTPGLRNLQERENLLPLLDRIMEDRAKACGRNDPPPLLVKLSPDLKENQKKDVADTLLEAKVDGVILTNTTLDRPDYLPADFYEQAGGLSGPLTQKSTDLIRDFYRLLEGKIPIIGAGGISDAKDAYAKIKAGATLVQLYSALVFQGPELVPDLLHGLINHLEQDKFSHITQAIGKDAR